MPTRKSLTAALSLAAREMDASLDDAEPTVRSVSRKSIGLKASILAACLDSLVFVTREKSPENGDTDLLHPEETIAA